MDKQKKDPHSYVELTCQQCGVSYQGRKDGPGRFCSRVCAGKAKRNGTSRPCERCGAEIVVKPSTPNKRFCSHACKNARDFGERSCAECGTPLVRRPGEMTGSFRKRKTCGSKECKGKVITHGQGRLLDAENLVEFVCRECGTPFMATASRGDRQYCSQACQRKARRVLHTCEVCGKQWIPSEGTGDRYCSRQCAGVAKQRPDERTCPTCGETFVTSPMSPQIFCSRACFTGGPNAIEQEVYDALDALGVPYESQARLGRWVVDAFIPDSNIVIEVMGTYWHCDPAVYVDGPVDSVQRNNVTRDARKRDWFAVSPYQLVIVWEREVRREGARALLERTLTAQRRPDSAR